MTERQTFLVKKITVNKNTDAKVSITGSFEFEKHRLIRGGWSALGKSSGK